MRGQNGKAKVEREGKREFKRKGNLIRYKKEKREKKNRKISNMRILMVGLAAPRAYFLRANKPITSAGFHDCNVIV